MPQLSGMRLAVAGAGVFGLCVALRAAAAGATVELWDSRPLGDNASGVAAGMIAPIGEALFDDLSASHVDLFRAGRDGWRELERLAPGLMIDRSGAMFLFETEAERDAAVTSMNALNADHHLLDKDAIWGCNGLTPSLIYGARTVEDWRVDPPLAMAALRAAFVAAGGLFRAQALALSDIGAFDVTVLAAGMETRAFASHIPELSALSPIKGQLVRFHGGAKDGPVIRTRKLYLAPQSGGVLAGATMEIGLDDRTIDEAVVANLRQRAIALMPSLETLPFEGQAGVRAATPDGLPLAGPSSRPGLYLATGARRNGWLLAPLVSQMVLSYLSGGDGGPFAAPLDPRRFAGA